MEWRSWLLLLEQGLRSWLLLLRFVLVCVGFAIGESL
jgi:hypothetical protein